jgi:tRNA threonylcarbamoyl adenosine modification protein YeaZ
VLGQAQSETSRGHAEVIGTLIQRALTEAGLVPADITVVAAGMGPGPFTGLRIGIAAARAFAIGRGIPVVPVVSHDAAALEILSQDPEAEFVIATDARRRENAVSAYAGLRDGLPNRIAGPELVAAERAEILTIAREGAESAEKVSISPHPQNLSAPPASAHPRSELTRRIPATSLAVLAARQIKAGTTESIEPLYLRAPDAKVPGAVKRVST